MKVEVGTEKRLSVVKVGRNQLLQAFGRNRSWSVILDYDRVIQRSSRDRPRILMNQTNLLVSSSNERPRRTACPATGSSRGGRDAGSNPEQRAESVPGGEVTVLKFAHARRCFRLRDRSLRLRCPCVPSIAFPLVTRQNLKSQPAANHHPPSNPGVSYAKSTSRAPRPRISTRLVTDCIVRCFLDHLIESRIAESEIWNHTYSSFDESQRKGD